MAKTAYVVQENCIACELCTKICVSFFMNPKTGKSEFCEKTGSKEEEIQDAIDNCPVQCIEWLQ